MHEGSLQLLIYSAALLQVLLWRPAELLNGRLAMIGFTAAIANEAITGASLWQQLYFAPYAYLSAYLLVVAAAQLNRAFGSPNKGTFHTLVVPFLTFPTILRMTSPCMETLTVRTEWISLLAENQLNKTCIGCAVCT